MAKKIIRYVGNILTLAAFVFLIRQLLNLDIDYSIIFSTRNIIFILIGAFAYSVHIFFVGVSWKKLIHVTTGERIAFANVVWVWCRSNMLKYVPGNVFQYVGRNQIATTYNLSHIKIGLSTLMDVLLNLLGVFFVGVIFYYQGLRIWLASLMEDRVIAFVLFMLLVLATGGVVIGILFRKNKASKIQQIRNMITKVNIRSLLWCFGYYAFWAVYTGYIFIFILIYTVGMSLSIQEQIMLLGAFLISWIIGFIMPGSPGGIGVREAVLTLIVGSQFSMEAVLLGIVIYRFINIIGDLLGLLFAYASLRYSEARKEK